VQACRRSNTSYPLAISGLPTISGSRIGTPIMRACHGARIAEVYQPIHEPSSQLADVTLNTRLATITVGGNDINFEGKLVDCIVFSCTRPLLNENELFLRKLELTALYREILLRMPDNGFLFVLSYPQFFPNPDEGEVPDIVSCFGTNLTFSIDDLREIARATRQLRDTVQQAAAAAASFTGRVIFVDMIDVFRGHRICSEDPWANGFRFPELGGSFHPNARGHQAMAQRLYSQVSLFY
jgi:lysophospholipase L1-like esterase